MNTKWISFTKYIDKYVVFNDIWLLNDNFNGESYIDRDSIYVYETMDVK